MTRARPMKLMHPDKKVDERVMTFHIQPKLMRERRFVGGKQELIKWESGERSENLEYI